MTYRDLARILNGLFTDEQLDQQVKLITWEAENIFKVTGTVKGVTGDTLLESKQEGTLMFADERRGTYICGPNECGYKGKHYCMNCGYTQSELTAR